MLAVIDRDRIVIDEDIRARNDLGAVKNTHAANQRLHDWSPLISSPDGRDSTADSIRPACVRSWFGPSSPACDRPSARHRARKQAVTMFDLEVASLAPLPAPQ